MSALTILMFVGGLALLILGAEWLVKGASRLAAKLGISPLVIGLTVVAFGTSTPELAVSVQSSLAGQADIALGNVVGSNIFNVLFILGVSAIITPLLVQQQLIRLDVPIMIGVSFVAYLLVLDGLLNRWEGLFLFTGLVGYTVFLITQSRKEKNALVALEYHQEYDSPGNSGAKPWLINIGLVVAGLGLLIVGSNWLVESAIATARWLGLSELIIGLTIVAAGTSMPEVATSIAAALKGERDIAVGNVVGSNIFNLLGVLGLTAAVAPAGVPVSQQVLGFDLPVMLGVAIASLPIFFTGNTIARWEGWFFLGFYVAYTVYLIMDASQHQSLSAYSSIMLWFVAPLLLVTVAATLIQDIQARRNLTSGNR